MAGFEEILEIKLDSSGCAHFTGGASVAADGSEYQLAPFIVRPTASKGNAMFAARDIAAGEVIFSEIPLFWNVKRSSTAISNNFCQQCGVIVDARDIIRCEACASAYCSARCVQTSLDHGHRFLCKSIADGSLIDELCSVDSMGNYGLVLKLYAYVAQKCCERIERATSTGASAAASIDLAFINSCCVAEARLVLWDLQHEDYCRTIHAFRTGHLTVDPDMQAMFDSLIAPAYYSSSLAGPLAVMSQVFVESRDRWVSAEEQASDPAADWTQVRLDRVTAFLQCELFSEMYFRRLVGSIMVNALTVSLIPAAGSENQACISGTGMFRVYAKMNHSCECNIINETCERAKVRVSALRDIAVGEEITTSYLHTANAASLTQRRRARMLRQYLFECQCALCQREKALENSDSDDDEDDDEEEEDV